MATLDAPVITAKTSGGTITLSWKTVKDAVEYQIFGYNQETGLVSMLDRTADTSIKMTDLTKGETYSYIVQPISYVGVADNVSPENCVTVICK